MTGTGAWNPKHPNVGLLLNPPILVAAKLLSLVSAWEPRRWAFVLSLLVCPLFSALQTVILYLSFRTLRITWALALLLATFSQMSMSRLLLGSIPESYPLSALGITCLFWLVAHAVTKRGFVPSLAWLAAGVFTAGMTTTNGILVPLGLFLARAGRREALRPRVLRTVGLSALVLAVNLLLMVISWGVYPPPGDPRALSQDTKAFFGFFAAETAREFPVVTAYGFFGPRPAIFPNTRAIERERPARISFSYREQTGLGWSSGLRVRLLAALLGAGLWGWRSARPGMTAVPLFALVSIGFHYVMYSLIRGPDLLLYSLHWQVPVMYLVAGIAYLPGRARSGFTVLLAVATVVAAYSSYEVVSFIVRVLEDHLRG